MEKIKNMIMKKDFNEMTTREKLQFVCVFLPILATIGSWVMYVRGDGILISILEFLLGISYFVGLVSTIVFTVLTKPFRIFKTFLTWIIGGFSFGMALVPIFPICFVSAIIGLGIVLTCVFGAYFFVPVVITVYFYYFFKEEK